MKKVLAERLAVLGKQRKRTTEELPWQELSGALLAIAGEVQTQIK